MSNPNLTPFQYEITKTYGHDLGLSACFRQKEAVSHCRHIHGYALAFKLTYGANKLDRNGWVLDFGSLKPLKAWLVDTFDHKMLVHQSDPALQALQDMQIRYDNVNLQVTDSIGCEAFARMTFQEAKELLIDNSAAWARGARLISVECKEHGANSAICYGSDAF